MSDGYNIAVEPVELDDMLDPERAAKWMKLELRDLEEKQRTKRIVGFKISKKVIRYHPRTIIAKLAKDAGVPMDVIAASLGMKPQNQ